MEREDIEQIAEAKVRVAIAELRAEILPKLAEIKERIIGIDGNGTGRVGAIQVLDTKMDKMAEDVSLILTKDAETKGALAVRQRVTAGIWTVVALVGSAGSVVLTEFVKHKMGW